MDWLTEHSSTSSNKSKDRKGSGSTILLTSLGSTSLLSETYKSRQCSSNYDMRSIIDNSTTTAINNHRDAHNNENDYITKYFQLNNNKIMNKLKPTNNDSSLSSQESYIEKKLKDFSDSFVISHQSRSLCGSRRSSNQKRNELKNIELPEIEKYTKHKENSFHLLGLPSLKASKYNRG
jgi:hypothetical protein